MARALKIILHLSRLLCLILTWRAGLDFGSDIGPNFGLDFCPDIGPNFSPDFGLEFGLNSSLDFEEQLHSYDTYFKKM